MRVPLSWLREYVPIPIPTEELSHRLTLAGVAVESVERTGGDWEHVYVGEIVRIEPHPNADRLRLATIEYGADALTVVTGAPNIEVGARVPFALVGAELLDHHQSPPRRIRLKASRIRGVESAGMVCSAAELGLGDDHSGILILDPATPVGAPLRDVLGDTVLGLELTPNRSDCLSMLGVAREVSALIEQPYREPTVDVRASGAPTAERVQIEIADPALCRRYSAALVEGITVAPSPSWLQERLVAAGIRPINNVVDVTNYVMLEYGQPLHAFDFDHVGGARIVVRPASRGERLRTLDGVDRVLDPSMLVIADAERPVALAGIMGGEESEVSPSTTRVLLESACFDPTSIRRTGRALRLPSEASRRFEKGLPPELTIPALARAAQLLRDLAGGEVGAGWVDCYPDPAEPRTVDVAIHEFERLLGVVVDPAEAASILARLGFSVSRSGDRLMVGVPYRRVDVAIPADVVEEVARVRGYDELPATVPAGRVPDPNPPDDPWAFEERIRDVLVGCGLTEVITYSLISEARLDRFPMGAGADALAQEVDQLLVPGAEPLRLVNPLSSEMDALRTTAFPHLLETVRSNLRWTDRDVTLFELGRIYLGRPGDLPEERRVLTLATGAYVSGLAWGSRQEIDFFYLKGIVETLLDRLGVDGVTFAPIQHAGFRRGHCAAVLRGDARGAGRVLLGVLGEVALPVRRSFDIDETAFLAGFDVGRLRAAAEPARAVKSLSRFPAVYQDLAVVLPETVPAADVRRTILRAGRPLAIDAELFDVYVGERIGSNRRSLAYRITYQSPERTLTDREVGDAHARIESALEREYQAQVRGRG